MGIRNKRYVIVGDGAAGITAARTLRQADGQAEISIVADDPNPAYFRAALTNYLMGELREEQIWATRPQFYDQYAVQRVHARCTRLDAERGHVLTSSGTALSYDALLLACGARARKPVFPGAELGGVMTLRTLQDCRAITERIASGCVSRALVLGGGPLALEWALGMQARGISVGIVLRGNSFMPGTLDAIASDLLAARLRQAGLELFLDDEVVTALPDATGNVAAVVTRANRQLPCQLLAAGLGVVPNTEWLNGSGIQIGRRHGVLVDAQMKTSAARVFAAGDVVEFGEHALKLWEPAQAQARVAARNMVGTPASYAPGVHYMATRLFDLDFASLGSVAGVPGAQELVDMPSGTGRLNYRKLVIVGGRLVGALMLGQREDKVRQRGRLLKQIMDHDVDVSPVAARLLDRGFDVGSWLAQQLEGRPAFTAPPAHEAAPASIAKGAELRGTRMLSSTSYDAVAGGAATAALAAAAGTSLLSPLSGPPPAGSDLHLRATQGLGTQMLGQFNLRPAPAVRPAAAQQRRAFLMLAGHPVELHGALCRIGRQVDSEVPLNDPSVSYVHAHLQLAGSAWYVRDLGSQDGTWLNGEMLAAPRCLASGDKLRIGRSELVFFYEGDEAQARASLAGDAPSGPPRPRLEVRSGLAMGLVFWLRESPSVLGSDPACKLWVNDQSIAPQHARLTQQGASWQITCSSETAGFWVDQRALPAHVAVTLQEGNQLRLGAVNFVFSERPVSAQLNDIADRSSTPATTHRGGATGQRMQAFAAVSADQLTGESARQNERTAGAPVPSAPGRMRLRVESGPDAGQRFVLGDYALVGRQVNSHCRLSDASVLPQHLELQAFAGVVYVRNLGAPGSCTKNGAAIAHHGLPLTAGDRLQLGPHSVLVYEEDR